MVVEFSTRVLQHFCKPRYVTMSRWLDLAGAFTMPDGFRSPRPYWQGTEPTAKELLFIMEGRQGGLAELYSWQGVRCSAQIQLFSPMRPQGEAPTSC